MTILAWESMGIDFCSLPQVVIQRTTVVGTQALASFVLQSNLS